MLDAVGRAEGTQRSRADARHGKSILPVEARGLVYRARGVRLLDQVDLRLEAGPLTVIMGPNGAGKTLLVRLLHGMIAPSAGSITWDGAALDDTVRRRQAMVFQTPVVLRRSVAANIAFVLKLRGADGVERRAEMLDLCGLGEHAYRPARLLSGGERQRLAVAMALSGDPDVLFLDEPTASLDPGSVVAIEAIVARARARGVKIIFITHDVGQARRLADEVVFMHRGRILERAPAERFFDRPQSAQARDYLAGRIVL